MRPRSIVTTALLLWLPLAASCGEDEGEPQAPCAEAAVVDGLRLNQIQVLGSHNSYRRRTYQPLFDFAKGLAATTPELDPASLDYDHLPLAEQLDTYGMRGLELDIFNDPQGGQFYERRGLGFVGEPTAANIPGLLEPGFKVLHIPDFDYETHHISLREALATIKTWSDAHPRHLPLFVHIESKENTIADAAPQLELTRAIPFDAAAADALDAEIRAVFPDSARLITPDEVRGTHATLEAAVLAGAWPLVGASRGRLLFFLEGAAVDEYVAGAPGLQGRLIFAVAGPGQDHAAFILMNGPVGNEAAISDLVGRGYLVRTMGDAGTTEARTGDRTRLDAGLGSGAHVVSTDYYRPDPRGGQPGSGWTNYKATLPGGGPARANPVSGGMAARLCE